MYPKTNAFWPHYDIKKKKKAIRTIHYSIKYLNYLVLQ